MPRRKFQKAASRTKKEARENAARALQKTKAKVDIDAVSPLKGVTPSPLVADIYRRAPKTAPTSDRIPGYAPAKDIFHEHKWKEGAEETEATPRNAPESQADRSGLQQGSTSIPSEGDRQR
jgi:hypothetical protein